MDLINAIVKTAKTLKKVKIVNFDWLEDSLLSKTCRPLKEASYIWETLISGKTPDPAPSSTLQKKLCTSMCHCFYMTSSHFTDYRIIRGSILASIKKGCEGSTSRYVWNYIISFLRVLDNMVNCQVDLTTNLMMGTSGKQHSLGLATPHTGERNIT